MITAAPDTDAETLQAIIALTVELGYYPSPARVAKRLGISRQLLNYRLNALEKAGRIMRLNDGHNLKIT